MAKRGGGALVAVKEGIHLQLSEEQRANLARFKEQYALSAATSQRRSANEQPMIAAGAQSFRQSAIKRLSKIYNLSNNSPYPINKSVDQHMATMTTSRTQEGASSILTTQRLIETPNLLNGGDSLQL